MLKCARRKVNYISDFRKLLLCGRKINVTFKIIIHNKHSFDYMIDESFRLAKI